VVGVLQVYSVDLKASQPTMDAHSACFANVQIDGRENKSNLFCFTTKVSRLWMREDAVGRRAGWICVRCAAPSLTVIEPSLFFVFFSRALLALA